MPYVCITIYLRDHTKRSGVRSVSSPLDLDEVRLHAWRLSADVFGEALIQDVTVQELSADDPRVVALIINTCGKTKTVPRSDGVHPYLKHTGQKPPR